MFYTNAAIYGFAAVLFLLIGSGDLQPWADNSKHKTTVVKRAAGKGAVNTTYVADADEVTYI